MTGKRGCAATSADVDDDLRLWHPAPPTTARSWGSVGVMGGSGEQDQTVAEAAIAAF